MVERLGVAGVGASLWFNASLAHIICQCQIVCAFQFMVPDSWWWERPRPGPFLCSQTLRERFGQGDYPTWTHHGQVKWFVTSLAGFFVLFVLVWFFGWGVHSRHLGCTGVLMMGNCCNREVLSGADSCFQNVCYEKQVCAIQNAATHNQGWICMWVWGHMKTRCQ